MVGPFLNKTGELPDPTQHPPERWLDLNATYPTDHGRATWRPVDVRSGLIRLDTIFRDAGERPTVYAVAVVRADEDLRAELFTECRTGCTVWVNGEEPVSDSRWGWYRATAHLKLNKSDNVLLFKVSKGRQWSLSATIAEFGPQAGGRLRVVPAEELKQVAALTPDPLPPASSGVQLPHARGVAWKLVAEDDFAAGELRSHWRPKGGDWTVHDGVLHARGPGAFLAHARRVEAPVRIEYDARGEKPLDLAAFYMNRPPNFSFGYLWSFASGRTGNKLLVNGQQVLTSREPKAVPGTWHHIIAQILPGGRVQLIVNDQEALNYQQPTREVQPSFPGLWTWGEIEYDNVKIFQGWQVAE
jgi:hypothetical protein